jgi:hypothetical protein
VRFPVATEKLSQRMGALLGPAPIVEIVITMLEPERAGEDEKINFQVISYKQPVSPGVTYKILECVARSIAQDIQPEVQTISTGGPNE